MYNAIITKIASTEALFRPKIHQVSFGGQAPPGPTKELKCSPRFLSPGQEKM